MNNLTVKQVNFMGDSLLATQDIYGNIWAGVSYICKGIGLNKNEKDRQVKNVQSDEVISRGCVKFDAGVFDPNNETVALRLDYVPLWLAKISITPQMKEETPQVVEKLVNYQLKVKDILAQAFLPQYQYPQQIIYKKQLDLRAITLISKTTKGNMPVVLQALNKGGYDVEGLDLYIQPHYEVIDSGIIDIVNETKEIINKLLDKNNFLTQYIATNELRKLLYQKRK